VEELGPKLFADVKSSPEQGLDPANLLGNLHRMGQSLTTLPFSMDFLLVPALAAFVALAAALARRDPRRWLALSLVHLGLLGSLLFHGYFFETRIYLSRPLQTITRSAEERRTPSMAPHTPPSAAETPM
jgi:hypothetical protein